jgi:DUF1680 family protein
MKLYCIFLSCLLLTACNSSTDSSGKEEPDVHSFYLQNRAPLIEKPYLELPLGSIKAKGWLLEQLNFMKTGMTGNLDSIYPEVVGSRNGWLGGDGDGWERGPYWIDGLLPLAYILEDEALMQKAQTWIEWTLSNQTEAGYIGPVPFEEEPEQEAGLQRGNRRDWWPKMVMLKVLQQYHAATGDERVIDCLTRYFRYQLRELPNTPLDHLSLWANRRGGDNLMVVYWLYNITGEQFLLELGELIYEQTFPWTRIYTNEENYNDPVDPWHYAQLKRYPFDEKEISALTVSQWGSMHCVNFAQALKQPIVYYQKEQDVRHITAVKKALKDIKKYHGQPQGMYGGDEPLHGTNPIRGVEFCSVAEEMFSLETILKITGDMEFADLLERIAYNALPAQASDDYSSRQYFQAANQVELSTRMQSSYQTRGHAGTDFVFGTLTGYPCCTCNMHQAWPKYVQNLFYATKDKGVAALLYGPSQVSLTVGEGTELTLTEKTGFPFREEVHFSFRLSEAATFPFHLRIPEWASEAEIKVNGKPWEEPIEGRVTVIHRQWEDGDQLSLRLPMALKASYWHDFSRTIERGPLVYALKIREEHIGVELDSKELRHKYRSFSEVYPLDAWNYALMAGDLAKLNERVQVQQNDWDGSYPWNLENAPMELHMQGVKLPQWSLHHGVPYFPAFWGKSPGEAPVLEEITLVPYGCTTLRITEFPVSSD